MERPTVGGSLPDLADYVSATMSNAAARRVSGGHLAYQGARNKPITMTNGADILSTVHPDRREFHAFQLAPLQLVRRDAVVNSAFVGHHRDPPNFGAAVFVESIQTVGTSQPEIAVRGLCQCLNYIRRAVFRTPHCVRELRNGPIVVMRGRTRAGKDEEKADLQRPGTRTGPPK
jgi:hypothetical protein